MNRAMVIQQIRDKALEMGFLDIAFARAEEMTEEAHHLERWLSQNYHGEMSYMENHFEKRIDPRKLVPGAKTVISLSYNYFTTQVPEDPSAPKLSIYAYGRDYHKVVKKKMMRLFSWMQETYGEIAGRCFVDSAPVLERDWAKRSGLGWIGKNSLLLSKKKGSYFFLGEIICDLVMPYDRPTTDHCGQCTRCIDACPTDAISPQGYLVDGSRCISYLTIEKKGTLPEEFQSKMQNWMFGCDICQEVCPWNRFAHPHQEPDFVPSSRKMAMTHEEWQDLSEEVFKELFYGTPVKRTGYEGLKRNIDFLKP